MKNIRAILEKPIEVAVYASLTIEGHYTTWMVRYADYDEHYDPLPDGERREVPVSGYVRISEPMKLLFKAADDDSMIRNAVATLDEEERRLRDKLNRDLANIADRRNQLLALTHQPDIVA